MDPEALANRLERRLRDLDGVVVALSGGVDSSVVAGLAARALAERALAVTAVSPALAAAELEAAKSVAAAVGIRHQLVHTRELTRAGYRLNGKDRCYHCKSELYEQLDALALAFDATVVSGANADDLGDWRPGLRAAAEHGVVHPLLEAGVGKDDVRALARMLALPTAEKPASPCLASRFPYGMPVGADALAQVERAERAVRGRGYAELRVRHYGEVGRLELPENDLQRALRPGESEELRRAICAAGFRTARISRRPLRSGSLNAAIVHSGS